MSATPETIIRRLDCGDATRASDEAARFSQYRLFQAALMYGWPMQKAMVAARLLKGLATWNDYARERNAVI